MIQPLTSGNGWKVFDKANKFIGAYTNINLAEAIDQKGAVLTNEEFNSLFGVDEKKEILTEADEV